MMSVLNPDMSHWVVDGSSIEYLDLRIYEFQREKIPSLISSLDLSLRSIPPTAPYVPLIPVFQSKFGRMLVSNADWTNTVFFDFSRSILQKLELNFEEDTAKLYVSHLRAFCHYVERCFYSATCFTIDLSPQRKCGCLLRSRIHLINSLKLEASWKLVEILFGKVRLDSAVIMDILEPICSWKKLAQFSLKSDPSITDSILSHLRRNKRWVTTEELIKFFSSDKAHMIRTRPKNLLLFLNYGFKNIYNPMSCYNFLYRMTSHLARNTKPCFRKIYYDILDCFRRRMSMDKREAMILEMCGIFLGSNERNLSNYIESMCYIWRSIPDAYITLEEIKHTLFKFLTIENDEFAEEICHELQRRGFNGFQHKQETNSAQTREEPETEFEDLWFPDSPSSDAYDSPDDRLSMHNYFGDAKIYSGDSKFQLLDEQFCTNTRLSKNPESPISLPRGVFLPYRFTDPFYFLRGVIFNLILLISVANSLIDLQKRTIQPHSPLAHNLGAAEEALAGTSQRAEEPEIPAVRPRRDDMFNILQQTRNPLSRIKNLMHNLRSTIRELLIRNSQWTEDSVPQAREQQPEGRVRNTSISSSKLPEEPDNPMNPQILFPDSRSASRRNARDSNFQLPDEGFLTTPPERIQFSYSEEAVRYRANYDPYFPEGIVYHQNTNSQPSQASENPEIPFSRARNIAKSRIRTVMARILTIPGLWSIKRLLTPPGKITRTVRDSVIRILQWTEDSADPYILNLQLPEDPNIQTSSLFLCDPDETREVPKYKLTFPDELDPIHAPEDLLFDLFTQELARDDLPIHNSQRTEETVDRQARDSRYVEAPENSTIQTSSQFLHNPGINQEVRISSPQLQEQIEYQYLLTRNPLLSSLRAPMLPMLFGAEWILLHASSRNTQVRDSQLPKKTNHAGPQPRRLLHYTRCVIRDALILNSQLPQGITVLKLADRLQSYLKLEL